MFRGLDPCVYQRQKVNRKSVTRVNDATLPSERELRLNITVSAFFTPRKRHPETMFAPSSRQNLVSTERSANVILSLTLVVPQCRKRYGKAALSRHTGLQIYTDTRVSTKRVNGKGA